MEKKKVTVRMLAKILGVSVSTVSKALNDSHEISDKTKRRILKNAKRYNYIPNRLAANLKFGKTNTIGVIIPSIQNNFFTQVLVGIEKEAAKNNYNIIISISDESFKKEVSSIEALSSGIVDGFIIAVAEGTQTKGVFDHFALAIEYDKPIVMFDRIIKEITCNKVIVDDYDAVYNVTNHLIRKGKKKIALASTIHNLSVGKSRIKGYKDAMKNTFNSVNDSLIIKATKKNIRTSIKELFLNNTVDAIIALDEETSLEVLKKSKAIGLQIPKQLSIVGYASEKIATNVSPALTTINQHGVEIGKTSTKLLIKKLTTNSKKNERIVIKSTINSRATD